MISSASILQFREFTFDANKRELCKGDFRIRISASQIRLLTLFLERPGQLVTRDEIARRLWTETTTIDVDRGINTAINSLRTTLRDDPADPVFLETLIGLGYRFIAPVQELEIAKPTPAPPPEEAVEHPVGGAAELAAPSAPPALTSSVQSPRWARWSLFGTAFALLLGLAWLGWLAWSHSRTVPPSAPMKIAEAEFEPATFDYGSNKVSAAAVSPDGVKVAYADNFGISMHRFDGSPDKLWNTQPGLKVDHLSWLPTGLALAVSGSDAPNGPHQVWLIEPSSYGLLDLADASMAEASPDGALLAFTRKGGQELWTATIHGDKQRLLLTGAAGEVIRFLLWSRDGRYLLLSGYGRAALPRPEAWFYESVEAGAGHLLSRTDGVEVDSGFLSPDGTLHYVNQAPAEGIVDKTHRTELAIQTEPGTGRLLGAPRTEAELPAQQALSLSASWDGVRKAFLFDRSTLDIEIAHFNEGGTALKDKTLLTHGLLATYPHAWTPDGSVLFERELDGKSAIFSQHPGSAEPQVVARMPFALFDPQLSADGRWVLFMAWRDHANSLYRVPLAGGTPEPVPTPADIEDIHCPLRADASCVLSKPLGREAFAYYALDPIRGLSKELARTGWRPARLGSWSLSPDGARIAVADDSSTKPGLEIVTIADHGSAPRFVPLPGHGTVLEPAWSADGKLLYIECRTEAGFSLLYDKLPGGEAGVMGSSPYLVYAVPSRDGKMLALPVLSATTNVWMANR